MTSKILQGFSLQVKKRFLESFFLDSKRNFVSLHSHVSILYLFMITSDGFKRTWYYLLEVLTYK